MMWMCQRQGLPMTDAQSVSSKHTYTSLSKYVHTHPSFLLTHKTLTHTSMCRYTHTHTSIYCFLNTHINLSHTHTQFGLTWELGCHCVMMTCAVFPGCMSCLHLSDPIRLTPRGRQGTHTTEPGRVCVTCACIGVFYEVPLIQVSIPCVRLVLTG